VSKYRGSPTSTVSTSTNSTNTHFQKAPMKFNLYDFASKSPTCTNSTNTILHQSPPLVLKGTGFAQCSSSCSGTFAVCKSYFTCQSLRHGKYVFEKRKSFILTPFLSKLVLAEFTILKILNIDEFLKFL
jgi:hypothetical protein